MTNEDQSSVSKEAEWHEDSMDGLAGSGETEMPLDLLATKFTLCDWNLGRGSGL